MFVFFAFISPEFYSANKKEKPRCLEKPLSTCFEYAMKCKKNS
ncbi:hypothetical protein FLA_2751 [Filimonas lacunae]|nr:hypothetical protein FLA_2751 [Filimonas lacunae]